MFGLKPSHGRFPLYGVRQSFDGQNVVRSVLGPLGADLDAIEAFCSVTSAGKPWLRDPQTLPLPWKTDIDQTLADSGKKHYKFGLLLSDGVVEPHPPIKAALERTAELLRAHGHEVSSQTRITQRIRSDLLIFMSCIPHPILLKVVEWVPPSHADAFKIMVSRYSKSIPRHAPSLADCLSIHLAPPSATISGMSLLRMAVMRFMTHALSQGSL